MNGFVVAVKVEIEEGITRFVPVFIPWPRCSNPNFLGWTYKSVRVEVPTLARIMFILCICQSSFEPHASLASRHRCGHSCDM